MKRTVIRGAGRFLPPRVVTNEDMTQWMDTSWELSVTAAPSCFWVSAPA